MLYLYAMDGTACKRDNPAENNLVRGAFDGTGNARHSVSKKGQLFGLSWSGQRHDGLGKG